MANNIGTLVTSPVRPQSDVDTFPTAHANELLGGHQSYQNISLRNAIPAERRQEGMLVSVSGTTYILEGGTGNANWRDITLGNQQLIEIADAAAYSASTLVSGTSEGFPLITNVTWPGGVTGVLTMTEDTDWPGAVLSYYVTYGSKTLTQPDLTRNNIDGRVINKPSIIIS